MKIFLRKMAVGIALFIGLMLNMMAANAVTGYMSFLTTPIEVKTGDAASYMQVGRDWDGATLSITGIAQPIKLQESRIKTSRTATTLRFEFVIPDRTMNSTTSASSTLSCGDRVIVQIDPNNSRSGSLENSGAGAARDYKYMVTIKNKTIVDPLAAGSSPAALNKPTLYVPNAIGLWGSAAQPTGATATWTAGTGLPGTGGNYSFTLEIPLSEMGTPASDIGLALAIVNDLGHSHGTINELTGTAFPNTMGMTSVSEPGNISCAGAAIVDTSPASGNWINPSTWGTGFFSMPINADVIFSHSPNVNLSNAIRLGDCDANWNNILAVPSLAGWDAWQQNTANHWYTYNPPSATPPPAVENGPCRMSIWFNPQIPSHPAGTMTKKRFLVMWAGAGIAPQQWYVAGLTAPVAVVDTNTWVNFIWNALPRAAYTASSHPCLRVYALPDDLTPISSGFIPGATTADFENFINNINTTAALGQMESAYNVPHGSSQMAQMNFSNIGPAGGCTNSTCYPLQASYRNSNLMVASLDGWSSASEMIAVNGRLELSRDVVKLPGGIDRPFPVKKRVPSTMIIVTGFGVAAPAPKAQYVYIEDIGTVAFGVSNKLLGMVLRDFKLQLANPLLATKVLVGDKSVEIAAPSRNLMVSVETKAPKGTLNPVIDRRNLDKQIQKRFMPGQALDARIDLRPGR